DVEGLHFSFAGAKVEVLGGDLTPVEKKGKPAPPLNAHKFKVTLPANAPLGIQDVRIVTKAGISNPRAFVISDHKEVVEEEPNNDVDKAQRIDLNTTVNGVIAAPTDVDYFVFAGKKGQRVICSALTSSIDSRLNAFFPSVVEPGKETEVTVYGRNLPDGKIDASMVVNDRALEKTVVKVKASSDARALQRLAFTGMVTPPSSMLDGFDQRIKNEF